MRPAPLASILVTLVATPQPGLAQDIAAPPAATAPAPLTPKALPTDRSTGRLLGSWEHVQLALKRGDLGEAQRLSTGLSAGQWEAVLTPGAPDYLETALALLPAQDGAVGWLPLLSRWILISEPTQEERVVRVFRAVGALLDGRTPADLHEWDVPVATTRDVCRGLAWVAATVTRALDVRVAALAALGTAKRTCGPAPADFLADPSPEIRRAAAALVGTDPATITALTARLSDDSPEVASMVGARLCRSLGASLPSPELLQTARKFASQPVANEDAVDLLDCLAMSPADSSTLHALSLRGPKPIQARAKELLKRVR